MTMDKQEQRIIELEVKFDAFSTNVLQQLKILNEKMDNIYSENGIQNAKFAKIEEKSRSTDDSIEQLWDSLNDIKKDIKDITRTLWQTVGTVAVLFTIIQFLFKYL